MRAGAGGGIQHAHQAVLVQGLPGDADVRVALFEAGGRVIAVRVAGRRDQMDDAIRAFGGGQVIGVLSITGPRGRLRPDRTLAIGDAVAAGFGGLPGHVDRPLRVGKEGVAAAPGLAIGLARSQRQGHGGMRMKAFQREDAGNVDQRGGGGDGKTGWHA